MLFSCTRKCIFGVGMPCRYAGMFQEREGGIQVLAGLAPSSQRVGSLLRTPGQQSWTEKFGKKPVRWMQFNGKIRSTTFDQTHSAKL